MASSSTFRHSLRSALSIVLLLAALPAIARAGQAQDEPELKAVVQRAIELAPCFSEKFDSDVWFRLQEPRLLQLVKDANERKEILETAFCEATRPDERPLPPGLILAVMDVESRFDRWAVSGAGAVGLMQVMPFWPDKLGMQRHELTQIKANLRMGCAILRFYLQRERNDYGKALARYNGSTGKRNYSDLVITRWTTRWNGADDLVGKLIKR
jgi:soluble lytic murein transglycosylase-like protein